MVTIMKRRRADGMYYELADFAAYARELRQRGVEPPQARYRVLVRYEDEPVIRSTVGDWEQQIALFFQLSPAIGIEYEIQESAS
jgi:Uma2 family endonuclease